jgi:uncharacterized protein (DUF1697 family)
MNTYVCLIRAINVGGHSVIKMPDLCKLFESLGFKDVSTYIQTGNVLFKAGETDRQKLARKIEQALEAETGYKTIVFILTAEDLEEAVKNNPFKGKNEAGEGRSHIVFLSAEPSKENTDKLLALQGEDFSFAVHKNFLYYFYPEKYAGHTRRSINLEKVLGVQGTARTYKVVDKLIELAGV